MNAGTALVLLLLLPALSGAQVYKWVDKDGKVHYSDQPPDDPAAATETVDTSASQLTPAQQEDAALRQQATRSRAQEQREARQTRATERAERRAENQEQTAVRSEACRRAREHLDLLTRSNVVYRKNEEGEREFMDDGTRDQQMSALQSYIREHC